jgi:CRP-like cAMP-binding protein
MGPTRTNFVGRRTLNLEQTQLFTGLSADVLARIEELAHVETFAAGQTLFFEGDPAEELYILREGRIELTYTLPQDSTTEIRITQVGPGENFAWSALALGGTLSSHARALSTSNAFVIPVQRLHSVFYEFPYAGYKVMTRLSQQILTRLRETRKELRWLHQGAR